MKSGRRAISPQFTLALTLGLAVGSACIAARVEAQQCEANVPSECLTEALAAGLAGAEPTRAVALLRTGCAGADEPSCAALRTELQAHPEVRAGMPDLLAMIGRRCAAGSPSMCAQLGRDFVDDVATTRRLPRARRSLEAACTAQVGEACTALGVAAERRVVRPGSTDASRAAYQQGCELRDGRGCTLLGAMLEEGRGIAADTVRAGELFRIACELDDGPGCGRHGRRLVDTAPEQALMPLETGCNAHDRAACVALGRLHEERRIASANDAAARAAYVAACGQGESPEGCGRLGTLERRLGGDATAEPFLTLGCRGRDPGACASLGEVLAARGDHRGAAQQLTRGCRGGIGRACLLLGEATRAGRGVPRSEARANEWIARGCAAGAGEQDACVTAAVALAQPNRAALARPVLDPACTAGVARACTALANVVPRAERDATLRRACELGDAAACSGVPGAQPAGPAVAALTAAQLASDANVRWSEPGTTATNASATASVGTPETAVATVTEQPVVASIVTPPPVEPRVEPAAAQASANVDAGVATQAPVAEVPAGRVNETPPVTPVATPEPPPVGENPADRERRLRAEAEAAALREREQDTQREQDAQRARAAAEQQRHADEAQAAEQQRRAEAERVAEQARRAEAERVAEQARRAEAERVAEQARRAEADRIAAQQRRTEAEQTPEQRQRAEAARVAEQERRAEADRAAEQERRAEAERVAAQQRRTEAERVAEQERRAEAERVAEQQRRTETERVAEQERRAEAERVAAQQRRTEAEQQRAEAEQRRAEAEARRAAAAQAAEQQRAEAERAAEERRVQGEERRAAAARAEEERRAEAERVASERRAEAERTAEQQRLEQARLAEARAAGEASQATAPAIAASATDDARRGCARGESAACDTAVAPMVAEGRLADAYALLQRPCRTSVMPSCARVGSALVAAASAPTQAAHTQGTTLLARACGTGDRAACAAAARATMAAGQDDARRAAAERLLEPAVEANEPESVELLGTLLATGDEDARERALPLLARACSTGAASACERGATLATADGAPELEPAVAGPLLGYACAHGNTGTCERAGTLVAASASTDADRGRALDYLERACRTPSISACNAAVALAPTSTVEERARAGRLFAIACDGGTADTCGKAATMLLESPSAEDGALALRAAEVGCANDDAAACLAWADLSRLGRGTRIDRDKAVELYGRFCTRGVGSGCEGLSSLCDDGYLPACSRARGECVSASGPGCRVAQVSETFTEAMLGRRHGEDARAAELLRAVLESAPSPRVQAELGLALLGAERPIAAETQLTEALGAAQDPWVRAHRGGLELALDGAASQLAWLDFDCAVPGAHAMLVGNEDAPAPCGQPWRVVAGELSIEVRAPGQRSVRTTLTVTGGERQALAVALDPIECAHPDMLHIAGEQGGCCWPGQRWTAEGACAGTPACPSSTLPEGRDSCLAVDTAVDRRNLADVHFGIYGGVTSFLGSDTALFRPNLPAASSSLSLAPRAELRIGARLHRFLDLDLVAGGTMQDTSHWSDCTAGSTGCVDTARTLYGVDLGLMLQAHTNPTRRAGAIDLRVGAGVRPWTRLYLDPSTAGQATGQLTATVLPAELGMSVFLGAAFSLDLLGQAELWLPWEYCGEGPSGVYACTSSGDLSTEVAWSAALGLTVHIDG